MPDVNVSLMDKKTMLEVVRELLPSDDFVGTTILPMKDEATEKVMADLILTNSGIANYRAADAEAELKGKDILQQIILEIADIAKKERFNTTDVQAIREAGELPVLDDAPTLIAQIGAQARVKFRESLEELRRQCDNRIEWHSIQALLGTISVTSPVVFSVDFGIPSTQTGLTPTVQWDTTATSTPSDDLVAWQETVNDATGVVPDGCLMSRKALLYASKAAAFRDVVKQAGEFLFSIKQVKSLLQDHTGLAISIYDAMYHTRASTGTLTSTRMLDYHKIILYPSNLPTPGLGRNLTCPHPHGNYQPGFYTWDDTKKDPWGYEVGVGIKCFPVIYQPRTLLNATVLSADV